MHPHSRKLWGVSGSVHPHDENCRPSQALSTPPARKLGDVSGAVRPHHKIADSLRLWAFSVFSTHQNCGASQALCTPMMKIADSLRLCAPPSRKLGDVSGSVQPHDASCRQSQARRAPHPRKLWTSQAVCTPIIKSPTTSHSGHFLCSPFTKSAGRLRLSAPPRMKSADGLRLCAPPARNLRDV